MEGSIKVKLLRKNHEDLYHFISTAAPQPDVADTETTADSKEKPQRMSGRSTQLLGHINSKRMSVVDYF